jgi:pilus assembly protein CpaE
MPHLPTAEHGQASVELVALLPLMAVLAAVGWQLTVAGQAAWLAGTAARAAARAHALGDDAGAGARAALPVSWRDDVRVRTRTDGRVAVRLTVPVILSGGDGRLGAVAREARFAPQGTR